MTFIMQTFQMNSLCRLDSREIETWPSHLIISLIPEPAKNGLSFTLLVVYYIGLYHCVWFVSPVPVTTLSLQYAPILRIPVAPFTNII